jgi:hypothetical protein
MAYESECECRMGSSKGSAIVGLTSPCCVGFVMVEAVELAGKELWRLCRADFWERGDRAWLACMVSEMLILG